MAGKRDKKGASRVVIIRKIEGGDAEAHHGGAWKVAYADFVTAMMAFFLLMWLLNATTEDQRKGLADYFSPNSVLSHASSGTGEPFGGRTAFEDGALVSNSGAVEVVEGKHPPLKKTENGDPKTLTQARSSSPDAADAMEGPPNPADGTPPKGSQETRGGGRTTEAGGGRTPDSGLGRTGQAANAGQDGDRPPTQAEIQAEKARQEKASFDKAANDIRDAVRADPAMADLAKQLSIDMTPEGLRIQIMDEVKSPMFATGSADPNDRARQLLRAVTPVLLKLPEAISIAGHTDAAPYAGLGKTNWELSTERANTTRRLLTEDGLPESRIRTVTGHADRDPLLPGDPLAAANRRIAIVVLRDAYARQSPEPER